ncbi:ComEA family DNA-binding protein [Microvirga roseola]|uniref:ComEA family DNA-binding protein n=1 Tax=Microvirga roseola TaxID=2883126 RepID=UPI001E612A7A|nr:helix-hairpin-helix domain-containing protein [Microvirga roseola]
MHIGDLRRARSARFLWLRRAAFGALFVTLTGGLTVAAQQILPSLQEQAPPAEQAAAAPAPVQVADAQPMAAPVSVLPAPEIRVPAEPAPEPQPSPDMQAAAPEPLATPSPEPEAPAEEPAAAQAAAPALPEVNRTGTTVPAPTDGLVDLNTGSFEELNTLEDGGPIGRAIINARPYASVEELVTKKVLRRTVYEAIKDQVTVN